MNYRLHITLTKAQYNEMAAAMVDRELKIAKEGGVTKNIAAAARKKLEAAMNRCIGGWVE